MACEKNNIYKQCQNLGDVDFWMSTTSSKYTKICRLFYVYFLIFGVVEKKSNILLNGKFWHMQNLTPQVLKGVIFL